MASVGPHEDNVTRTNNAAIQLQNIFVSHGKKYNVTTVLNGIDLEVPEGTIYGLLGPSGCGKTTLLRCLVGKLKPTEGIIKVFGMAPGSPGSTIPGRGVGYMPQETALYKEFTIVNVLLYYGNLYGLDKAFMEARISFLIKFLDLPDKNRLIKNLSGGQQRRVSIAIALIHIPPLLILDEPTVGVDPLLRQNIWNYLITLAKTQKMTIIITTHYIEEARQANMVGLLRQGHLLASSDPDALMKHHNMHTLEEVFLKLCQKKSVSERGATTIQMTDLEASAHRQDEELRNLCNMNHSVNSEGKLAQITEENIADAISDIIMKRNAAISASNTWGKQQETTSPTYIAASNTSTQKTKAIFLKNVTRMTKNWPLLLFQVLLPAIQAALFCICVGREPFDLNIAIINYEVEPSLSKQFLSEISKKTIKQLQYNDTEDAIEDVSNGKIWGALHFHENYSTCLLHRITDGIATDADTITCSTVKLYMDMTNPAVTFALFKTFLTAFQDFAIRALNNFGLDPSLIELPIEMNAVHGSLHPKFAECILPGIVIIIVFIMAEALTALSLVNEKRDGLMERDWIAGATETNVILALAMLQFLVMFVQVTLCHFMILVIFQVKLRGALFLLLTLTILQGACGMACGLAISTVSNNENTAVALVLANFFPNFFLSGIVWPVEAMPYILRYISYSMPQTIAAEAMRSLFARGWGFDNKVIWQGYLITGLWTTYYFVLSRIGLNMKN